MNKTIAGGMFKSTSTEGCKAKTMMGIVLMDGDPTIHIYQRGFCTVVDKGSIVLRKCGDYYYCQSAVAFRFQSFMTILNFVDTNKNLIYDAMEEYLQTQSLF